MEAAEHTPRAVPDPPSSAIERIRQRRRDLAADKHLTLDVPGYGGHLAIRYHAIPLEEVNKFAAKIARGDGEVMEANADLLIRCCDAILVRQQPDGKLEPIADGEATTFSTATLPALLGVEADSARKEVFAVFSPDGSHPMAVGQHGDAVVSWLQGNTDGIDKALLGE